MLYDGYKWHTYNRRETEYAVVPGILYAVRDVINHAWILRYGIARVSHSGVFGVFVDPKVFIEMPNVEDEIGCWGSDCAILCHLAHGYYVILYAWDGLPDDLSVDDFMIVKKIRLEDKGGDNG
ncbi:MAG: hypothetical protein HC892_00400 [Saprospiraceae bacterium]|nr:hypothetical protein [Saprospiraceae bacterium]